MRVLINASGSYGDLYPFVAIGRELASRGHEVRLVASAVFEEAIRRAGLTAVPVGTAAEYDALVRHPDAFDPKLGFRVIVEANLSWLPESCRLLESNLAPRPDETLLVGSTLALAPRLVAEKHGLPAATVHLSPAVFRSVNDSPAVGDSRLPSWLPAPLKRAAYWTIDRLFVDPMVAPRLNRVRAEMGLEAIDRVFDRWIHGAHVVIGMFPDWFAPRQSDWPENVALTGFPLYDAGEETTLPPSLESFLARGAPPVVFAAGTAAVHEAEFFRASAEACRRSGKRGVLLTLYPEQLPSPLHENVRHFDYVPFSRLLPRAAALVHHGGIGTMSHALAAATPQLIRPLAFDQYDNAYRLGRLGAGTWMPPKRYDAASVTRALDELTGSADIQASCRRWAKRLADDDAVAATCDRLVASCAPERASLVLRPASSAGPSHR